MNRYLCLHALTMTLEASTEVFPVSAESRRRGGKSFSSALDLLATGKTVPSSKCDIILIALPQPWDQG